MRPRIGIKEQVTGNHVVIMAVKPATHRAANMPPPTSSVLRIGGTTFTYTARSIVVRSGLCDTNVIRENHIAAAINRSVTDQR